MTQTTTLLLIRHGETFWNTLKKYQGHQDIALNEKGVAQSQETAKLLKQTHPELAAIYSSDLIRAYQTAQALSEKFSLPIYKNPILREVSFGEAEGLTHEETHLRYGAQKKELDEKYPQRNERWKVAEIPGAETLESAYKRFTSCLQTIGKTHLGQTCAIITHGMLIKIFLAQIQNLPTFPTIPNCALISVSYCSVSQSLDLFSTHPSLTKNIID